MSVLGLEACRALKDALRYPQTECDLAWCKEQDRWEPHHGFTEIATDGTVRWMSSWGEAYGEWIARPDATDALDWIEKKHAWAWSRKPAYPRLSDTAASYAERRRRVYAAHSRRLGPVTAENPNDLILAMVEAMRQEGG